MNNKPKLPPLKKREDITFRASSVGKLLISERGSFSEINRAEIKKLKTRQQLAATGQEKPLTARMETRLEELEKKAKEPASVFGKTAQKFIKDTWLKDVYGVDDPLFTPEMLKGHYCQEEAFKLLDKVYPSEQLRKENKERRVNYYFSGRSDLYLPWEDTVEDVKNRYNIFTFAHSDPIKDITKEYLCQLLAYADLWKVSEIRLCYCLVKTPSHLLERDIYRLGYNFDFDESNPDYLEAKAQLEHNNNIIDLIPPEHRVKRYTWKVSDHKETLDQLKERVELAKEYYLSLSL